MKKIYAIVASIVFLLGAGAVDFRQKLPIGNEAVLRDDQAKYSDWIVANFYQEDEFGEEVVDLGSEFVLKNWNNYSQYENTLRNFIKTQCERKFKGPKYDSTYPVSIFFGSNHEEYLSRTRDFFSPNTFFGGTTFWPISNNGELEVPAGVLEEMFVQLASYTPFRSNDEGNWVTRAVLEIQNPVTGELIFTKDTEWDPTEQDLFVRVSQGALFIDQDYTAGKAYPGMHIVYTVFFEDDTYIAYDRNGDIQRKLAISLDNGKPVVTIEGGLPGEEIQLQSSTSLTGPWTNWPSTVKVQQAAVPPNGELSFFRITP